MTAARFLLASIACAMLSAWAGPATAQIPDKFTNLKVFPKNVSKGDLVAAMRGIATGLGVRCNHCHVAGSGGDLAGMDFASDDKREKKIARSMMKMVQEINGKLIPKTGVENPVQVRCATCHHGVQKPESLVEILKREFEKGGFEGAKSSYLDHKEKYYGGDSYSFKPATLNTLAEWLAQEKDDSEAAIAVMQFNLEQTPDVSSSYNLLGRIQAGAGHKEEAIRSLQKAIELDPDDKWTAGLLKKLQAGE